MAVPYRRAGGTDSGAGGAQRGLRADDDALYYGVFHAPRQGRPSGGDSGWMREFRLFGTVRGYAQRYGIYNGILRPHRYGSRLRAFGRGPGRAGGLGERI